MGRRPAPVFNDRVLCDDRCLTKGTPYPLYSSETIRELLHDEPADLTYVAELEVRGRREKVKPGIVAVAPVV